MQTLNISGPTPIQTQFTPARGGYDAGAASGLPYSMPNGNGIK